MIRFNELSEREKEVLFNIGNLLQEALNTFLNRLGDAFKDVMTEYWSRPEVKKRLKMMDQKRRREKYLRRINFKRI